MTKQITVGYDGSVPSSEAVRWAAAEATVRGARLRIVSCFEVPYLEDAIAGWPGTKHTVPRWRRAEASSQRSRTTSPTSNP